MSEIGDTFMVHFNFRKNQAGFTLIEIMVATMIIGILSIGLSSSLLSITRSQKKSELKANADDMSKTIIQSFNGKNKITDSACADSIKLKSKPQFSTKEGITNVLLNFPPLPSIEEGADFNAGAQKFKIQKVFFSNNTAIESLSDDKSKTYLSSLFIQVDQALLDSPNSRLKNLGTMTVTIKNNMLISCNSISSNLSEQHLCSSLAGMAWSEQYQRCQQQAGVSYSGKAELDCPPGTWRRADNLCVPVASDCGSQRLARGFKKGLVSGCDQATYGPSIGLASNPSIVLPPSATPSQEASAAPAIPPLPESIFTPPPTTQNVAAPTAPPNPPQSCGSSTSLNETLFELCHLSGFPCDLSGISSVGENCVGQINNSYSTPNLSANLPSYAPPKNNTCMCNNHRILTGSYCMYCLENVSTGWGISKYIFGVSECDNGILKPVLDAKMKTSGTVRCNNTYSPAVRSAIGEFSQTP